ncbi:MAG: pilus assembly protein PilM [Sedimentisphaerales bacterium]|nr:pilus assembly protein PilM [Sedimentisphaerales bacterium]
MGLEWKKLLGLEAGSIFGLDLGSSSVKLVQLERNENGYTAVAGGRIDIMAEENEEEIVRDIKAVRSITDCCRIAEVQSKYAVCGVCGPEVAVRYFKFPLIPAEEISSAVSLEAEQVCPFGINDSILDYQLVPDSSDSVRGMLVAATNKSIKRKEKMARDASVQPVLMDVDGLALLNCLYECIGCPDRRALAVLNVGHTYSTLVIAGRQTVPFVRDISHAGEKIVSILSQQTNLSSKKISEILFSDEEEQDASLLEAGLEDACKVLIDDVTGTLRYYGAQKKSMQIDTLYVCGGFVKAKGFVQILNSSLPVDVVLWNPFDKIALKKDCPGENLLRTEGPSLAVAAGLAMRSI